MATKRKAAPIDDYLRGLPDGQRHALEDLRAKIRAVLPDAEECISYRMPAFRVAGGVVAGFLATRKGCSYYPFSGSTLVTVARLVAGYEQTKGALHFSPSAPLSSALVRQLIKARLSELDEESPRQRPRSARRSNR